jgi:hypothetical protein
MWTYLNRRREVFGAVGALPAAIVLAIVATSPAAAQDLRRPKVNAIDVSAAAADTQRNAEVRQKLTKRIDVDFDAVPLVEVLAQLAEQAGVQLYVKWPLLSEKRNDVKLLPISLRLKDAACDMLLDLALEQAGRNAAYAVERGIVIVSTKQDLAAVSVLQVYNVRDLFVPIDEHSPVDIDATTGKLLRTIRSTIAPDSWEDSKGSGSATIFEGLLIVKQSPVVQTEIERLLRLLREANKPAMLPALAPPPIPPPPTR